MKYAIILANAAALIYALPQDAPSTPDTPSAAAEQLKPWVEGAVAECSSGKVEACFGSEAWCKNAILRVTEGYESAEACFAAREPQPGSTPVPAQQPEPSTDAAQQPEASTDVAQQPEPSTDAAQQPEASNDATQQPEPSTDAAQQPEPGTTAAQQPEASTDAAQPPAPAAEEVYRS